MWELTNPTLLTIDMHTFGILTKKVKHILHLVKKQKHCSNFVDKLKHFFVFCQNKLNNLCILSKKKKKKEIFSAFCRKN